MKKASPLYMILGVLLLTVIFGTIYSTQQQQLRIGANEPQIQLANDAAVALNNGMNPTELVKNKRDIALTLSPFMIIYDKNGRVLQSNALLNNRTPTLPDGVLQAADSRDYHAVTWQPQSALRVAAVIKEAKDYYVVSGRSLKETEKQELHLLYYVLSGYVFSLLLVLFGYTTKLRKR